MEESLNTPRNKLCHELRNAVLELYSLNKKELEIAFKRYKVMQRIEKALKEFSLVCEEEEAKNDTNSR